MAVTWSTLAPGIPRLLHYQRGDLRGDLMGGVTVAAYLVPQVMAYTILAGLPAQTGLWAAAVAMVVYAVLGSSRTLSVGPESTTALLTAATLAPFAVGDPQRYGTLAAALALLCGLMALVAWALRAGVIADLLSRPVLVGYMAGIAVIMIASQVERLTGIDTAGETLPQQVSSFMTSFDAAAFTPVEFLLGLSVAAALLLFAGRFPRLPMVLMVMLAATGIAALLNARGIPVETVGAVPTGLPAMGWAGITAADVQQLLLPALGVFVVAYADNVLTARSFAQRQGHRIDSNQELLALAGSNVAVSLVRGYPVSSSASRVAIAEAAGARTQLHSLVASASVILIVLLFGGLLAAFPSAALGGVVVYAAIRLIDLAEFRRLWGFRKREFALAVSAVVGVLVFDVLYGILIAVGLSILDLLIRVARPHAAVLGTFPDLAGWHDLGDYPDGQTIDGLVVFRYDSPLFFANADDFITRALEAVDAADPPPRWLLINVEGIVEVDITGLDALAELQRRCTKRGIRLALVRAKSELVDEMERHGVLAAIGPEFVFPTLPTAVAAYQAWVAEGGT